MLQRLTAPLRPSTPLPTSQRRLLAALVGAAVFLQYDSTLLSLLLPHVQRDLGIPEGQVGLLGGAIRASSLLAPLLLLASRRLDNRTRLIGSVAAYSLLTALTGLAPNVPAFVLLQACARAFIVAEGILSTVVLLDAVPRNGRGWAIGMVGTVGTLGAIAAYVALPLVGVEDGGWRTLYLAGAVPALGLVFWRRRQLVPAKQELESDDVLISAALTRPVFLLAGVVSLWATAVFSAWFFIPKHLHDSGWAPGEIGGVGVIAGLVAITGALTAGRLSDVVGRRPALGASLLLGLIASLTIFTMEPRIAVAIAWIVLAWSLSAGDSLVFTYGGELAPAGRRDSATTIVGIAWIAGGVIGLVGESVLYAALQSHGQSLIALHLLAVIALIGFAVARLPETAFEPAPAE